MYLGYTPAVLDAAGTTIGTGWLPPYPDTRDYTASHKDARPERNIRQMSAKLKIENAKPAKSLAAKVDLRQWCSPVENQGNIGSCTAHAAVGIVEYFERRAFGRHIDASRLFVYKTTRNLMGVTGDTGAWLRDTMAALRLCGAPPERYWPYTDRVTATSAGERTFDDEPSAFLYALADDYQAVSFFAHDPLGETVAPKDVLASVKTYLAAGVPAMFGFFGFASANDGDVPGAFPAPAPEERAEWGHAVVAVGYDDNLKITNRRSNATTKGALLIRNSWDTTWGDQGYGWLPYDYVLRGFAIDFWSLIKMAWVDTGKFGLDTGA